jgi:hypothetical protein
MRAVNLHLDRFTILEVRTLRGQMVPTGRDRPVTFDDANSFVTRISAAEIAMSVKTLSDLLNRRVFAYPGAPLKNISVTVEHGRIKQTGTIHKGVEMPFEIEGTLDATPAGEIRLHVDKIVAAHLPVKGLLHFFGEDLAKLITLQQDRGVDVAGAPKALSLPYATGSYMYHHGGILRFGKLTMNDADLEIVSESQRTPFDFSLPDYNRQLTAGYSKNTLSHGLVVFMRDFALLGSDDSQRVGTMGNRNMVQPKPAGVNPSLKH